METKEQHIHTLSIIYFVMAPLSMISSLFIISTFLKFPKKFFVSDSVHLKFVFFQSVCDFVFSAKFLITAITIKPSWINYGSSEALNSTLPMDSGSDIFCTALGFTTQFFMMASISWNLMVSLQIVHLFYFRKRHDYTYIATNEEQTTKTYYQHIFVWTYSLLTALVPLIMGQYGATTNGCWISDKFIESRLIFFVIPLAAFILASLIILLICLFKIKMISLRVFYAQQFDSDVFFPTMTLLVAYTVVFITFWTSPVILRIMEILDKRPVVFVYGDIVSISTQGMGNALVWLSSSYIRKLLLNTEPET